jgi:hypothetical protein
VPSFVSAERWKLPGPGRLPRLYLRAPAFPRSIAMRVAIERRVERSAEEPAPTNFLTRVRSPCGAGRPRSRSHRLSTRRRLRRVRDRRSGWERALSRFVPSVARLRTDRGRTRGSGARMQRRGSLPGPGSFHHSAEMKEGTQVPSPARALIPGCQSARKGARTRDRHVCWVGRRVFPKVRRTRRRFATRPNMGLPRRRPGKAPPPR